MAGPQVLAQQQQSTTPTENAAHGGIPPRGLVARLAGLSSMV